MGVPYTGQSVFGLVKDFGTSKSPKSTRPSTTYLCPGRPGHWHYATTSQARCRSVASSRDDWTPCSEAYFASPLARGTTGKQCGLTATGVYQPSLCSPWLAARDKISISLTAALSGRRSPRSHFSQVWRWTPMTWAISSMERSSVWRIVWGVTKFASLIAYSDSLSGSSSKPKESLSEYAVKIACGLARNDG